MWFIFFDDGVGVVVCGGVFDVWCLGIGLFVFIVINFFWFFFGVGVIMIVRFFCGDLCIGICVWGVIDCGFGVVMMCECLGVCWCCCNLCIGCRDDEGVFVRGFFLFVLLFL